MHSPALERDVGGAFDENPKGNQPPEQRARRVQSHRAPQDEQKGRLDEREQRGGRRARGRGLRLRVAVGQDLGDLLGHDRHVAGQGGPVRQRAGERGFVDFARGARRRRRGLSRGRHLAREGGGEKMKV